MSRKYGTFLGDFLTAVGEASGFFQWPLEYSDGWRRKQLSRAGRRKYYNVVASAKRKGLLTSISKKGRQFLELTAKGELYNLMSKMSVARQNNWDGKWRMFIFDIPEDARDKRNHLRWLLKKNNFVKLQQSVFVSPYPLNREALSYLSLTGLRSFIRIIKIEEIDDDSDLRKKFDLK
jgi:CRISPR-associated endonuclease Cas2